MLHSQHEFQKSQNKENQGPKTLQSIGVQPKPAKHHMVGPLAIQSLAASSNPILAEVKARSLSNQLEMMERKISFDKMLQLSTDESMGQQEGAAEVELDEDKQA